jgi:hypothetical protein
MAAKKAASKSNSRTSGKKGKSVKWWYILPVLAIVVLAGYLIVRYSEASTKGYSKGANDMTNCSGKQRYSKVVGRDVSASSRDNAGTYCVISGGGEVTASWDRVSLVNFNPNKICAHMFIGGNAKGGFRATADLPGVLNLTTGAQNVSNSSNDAKFYTICRSLSNEFKAGVIGGINPFGVLINTIANVQVVGHAYNVSGITSVNKMWLQK